MQRGWDRQKFITDAHFMRDVQRRIDSEYQAQLRQQEYERVQAEMKRECSVKQKTASVSIYATRDYERPWAINMSTIRKPSSLCEGHAESNCSKPPLNKAGYQLPAIENSSTNKKQKFTSPSKKKENVGARRQSENSGLNSFQTQKSKQPLKSITASSVQPSKTVPFSRHRSLRKLAEKHCGQIYSKSISCKEKGHPRKGSPDKNGQLQANGSLLLASPTAAQHAVGSFSLSESSEPCLPHQNTQQSGTNLFKFRDEDFYSTLGSFVSEEPQDDDDDDEFGTFLEDNILCANTRRSTAPSQISRFSGSTLRQAVNSSSEERPRILGHAPSRADVGSFIRPTRSERMFSNFPYNQEMTSAVNRSTNLGTEDNQHTSLQQLSLNPRSEEDTSIQDSNPHVDSQRENYDHTEGMQRGNMYSAIEGSSSEASSCYHHDQMPPTQVVNQRNSSTVTHRSLPSSSENSESSSHIHPVIFQQHPLISSLDSMNGRSVLNMSERSLYPSESRRAMASQESFSSGNPQPHESAVFSGNYRNSLSDNLSPRAREENLLQVHNTSESADTSVGVGTQSNSTMNHSAQQALGGHLPLTLLSQLRSLGRAMSSSREGLQEKAKPATDPEKLQMLQKSLLEESSEEEEEGDLCRICQIGQGTLTNLLVEPCNCGGSLQYVHQECLKKWLQAKINSGAELAAVKKCELCQHSLQLDFDDFDVDEYYAKHRGIQVQEELVNSGLYLVLLLHMYEQRFAELMRLAHSRAARHRLSRNYQESRTDGNGNFISDAEQEEGEH
ncbi:probable E3 ubiquitin-protein ligase MARCHF10 [Latimeria chalumnae]|uniref:RING-type E3 ubiquitin transferase n=1 Tax=Latimeria chalumnae TaxID=7897 RepID=M3XLA8_LATCH|nr:PREDICTED: probable E3 ubiquitin-protein ligase MARCH10 isoform X2 [Latimeria chalumnae]|eukprot:XP_014350925.1 PREDICTED: probable E3 ubiquitin-protein ligase MARCH10 isoform X2 [Latimeria chalumnae]